MKNFALILIVVVLFGGIFVLMQREASQRSASIVNNVNVVAGKQVVEINAKGGYSPSISTAKADMPTIIKMKTEGTFDCSSSLVIPSIGYQGNLPLSGETDIPVPAQLAGTTLKGLCAMGMYSFQINFS